MNILVTGANGQLGCEFRNLVKDSQHHYFFTDVTEGYTFLDITDADALRTMVEENHIDCIINCAAWTNVDGAETAGDIVTRLNASAPGSMAQLMKERDGLLVHISTDYVFGGDAYNTPCREEQQGRPTGEYGRSKLEGERLIQASGCEYLIFRTAWLYSPYGKNFVKTMMSLTASKPSIKVVFDQCGTPTYAHDLAEAIMHIVESKAYVGHTGVYHYSNEGVCSWYDFAVKIASLAGHQDCSVSPCHSDEFPSPVIRPAYSVLDKTKVKEVFGLHIRHWEDALVACMKAM